MDAVLEWAVALAATPWIYFVMYGFAAIDGFFPPIPSESVVITLTSLWRSTGQPVLGWVMVAAALGAFTGDQIAYQIGTVVKIRDLKLFQNPKGHAALDWAEHALKHRGASFILAARYIPVGRVAVNMTAGALRYPRLRFVAIDALASVLWAVYSSVIGVAAGALLGNNPLLGVAVGVVVGIILGFLVDWVLQKLTPLRIEESA